MLISEKINAGRIFQGTKLGLSVSLGRILINIVDTLALCSGQLHLCSVFSEVLQF